MAFYLVSAVSTGRGWMMAPGTVGTRREPGWNQLVSYRLCFSYRVSAF